MEDQSTEIEKDLFEALDLLEEALSELEVTWGKEAHVDGWPTRTASLLAKYERSN